MARSSVKLSSDWVNFWTFFLLNLMELSSLTVLTKILLYWVLEVRSCSRKNVLYHASTGTSAIESLTLLEQGGVNDVSKWNLSVGNILHDQKVSQEQDFHLIRDVRKEFSDLVDGV